MKTTTTVILAITGRDPIPCVEMRAPAKYKKLYKRKTFLLKLANMDGLRSDRCQCVGEFHRAENKTTDVKTIICELLFSSI